MESAALNIVPAAKRPAILSAKALDEKFRVLCRVAFDGVMVHDGRIILMQTISARPCSAARLPRS